MLALHDAVICPAVNKKPALSIWLRAGWICYIVCPWYHLAWRLPFPKERSSPTRQARRIVHHMWWDIIDALPPGNGGLPARTTGKARSSRIAARLTGPEGGIPRYNEGPDFHHLRLAGAHAGMYSSLVTTTFYAICQV